MGLSNRELTLVLRARDEASRNIGRLSSNMSKLDRDARRVSLASVRQSETNLRSLRRNVHDIEEAYQRQTLAAREAYLMGKITGKDYQRQMLAAQKSRVDQQASLRVLREMNEDQIHDEKEHMRLMAEEADAARHRGQMMVAAGTAAVTAGAGMVYFGARGLEAFASNIGVAMEYETAVARSYTQLDKVKGSLKDISDMGKRVADTVPVAFESIQPAIYDVFSSIDTNMKGAEKLVTQFSQDAVGGQADLETATRANLAIMNAYGISVEDAADVSDFMFRLVQKGVGTYDEFAKTIGRAIPSAHRAGQEYQTLGGMLAFMTRNGVSAAMAATSSARALDAISKTKVGERLHDIGVEVRNAKGEFRDLPDILADLKDKWKDLSKPELASAMEKLFLGAGGTIQARRFFDMYFDKSEQFNKRVKEMADTAGEAEKAFNTMAESPQAKLQKLKNNWMLMRIEMGENLMPIAFKLLDWTNQMIDKWQSLDPETRKTIVTMAALAMAITTVVGVLTIIGGVILITTGAAAALGTTVGAVASKMGLLAGGLTLLYLGFKKVGPEASKTDNAVGLFEATLGGAAVGMAVGGPVGAAIGGFAALVGTVGIKFSEARRDAEKAYAEISDVNPAQEARKGLEDLKETLDQVTGAYTEATRAAILHKLEENGMADAARKAGVPLRAIVNAAMGQKGAFGQIKPVLKDYVAEIGKAQDAIDAVKNDPDSWTMAGGSGGKGGGSPRVKVLTTEAMKQVTAYEKQKKAMQTAYATLREMPGELSKMGQETRENAAATAEYGHKLDKLPKNVRSKIKVEGIEPSLKGVAEVAKKYKLLDKKSIKTLIKASGADTTVKQVQKVIAKLKEAGKVKPDTKNFMDGVSSGLTRVLRFAKQSVGNVDKELKKTGKNAKMDAGPLKNSVRSGTDGAKKIGRAGSVGIGSDVKFGFNSGFAGAAGLWAANLAAAVRAAIAAGRKAAKAKSPSQETAKLGKDMMDGLSVGFAKGEGDAKDKMSKIVKRIMASVQKEIIKEVGSDGFHVRMGDVMKVAREFGEERFKGKDKKKQMKSFLAEVTKETKKDVDRLERINKRLQAVRKKLEDAKAALQAAKDLKSGYNASITDYGSFGAMGLDYVSIETIINEGNVRTAAIAQYGKDLAQLAKMGYSKAVIDQILAMPIGDAIAYARALVDATPAQVAAVNANTSAISGAGGLADQISSAMYNAGIQSAQALVDGLQEKEDELEKIAKHLGKLIAKAIKQALGIKSPSKVALDIARNFGGTLTGGLASHESGLANVSSRLARAMVPEPGAIYTRPPVVGGNMGAPAGTKEVHQPIVINTQEIDPRKHAAELAWELSTRTNL